MAYAVYTLPSVGDRLLWASLEADLAPQCIVSDDPGYWGPLGIEVVAPVDARARLDGLDFVLVAGWKTRIPLAQVAHLPGGAWNLHPSLLPKYRGYNPYFWVIARGETETGITAHRLSERFDEGAILATTRLPIRPGETGASLFDRLTRLQAGFGLDVVRRLQSGDGATTPQPDGAFVRAPKVREDDVVLHDQRTMQATERLVRAANPDPGALLEVGGQRFRVYEVAEHGVGLQVPCRDGVLKATVVSHRDLGVLSGRGLKALIAAGPRYAGGGPQD